MDRSGDLCFRLAAQCFTWRERIDPIEQELTPDAADRIWAGVEARIAAVPLPTIVTAVVFTPTPFELHCADVTYRYQVPLLVASTPDGQRAVMFPTRTTAGRA